MTKLISSLRSLLTPLFLRKLASAFLIGFVSFFALGATGAVEAAVDAGTGGTIDFGVLGSALGGLALGALAAGLRACQAFFTTWETPPK